jgi:hypothetical protein
MLIPLLNKVSENFPNYSRSCIKNVLVLVLCLLLKETLNLNKLKGVVGGVLGTPDIQADSGYKRLIRIFDNHAFSRLWLDLLSFVFKLISLEGDYLLLDGTSWKRGEKIYHYLTLCLIHEGASIPIYWNNLNKLGVSNTKERISLIKKARKEFNIKNKTLIADREYIGTKWFKYLINNELNFAIRLRKKLYKKAINQSAGKSYEALEAKIKRSKVATKALKKAFVLDGMQLYFVILKNPKNDPKEPFLYLITNLDLPARAIGSIYSLRWKIECCFKHLKTNGFQLESINLKTESRTRLLMAITVFAYVISIHEGIKNYKNVPIKTYKDGSQEKQESLFRYGINKVVAFCLSFSTFCTYILKKIKQSKKRKISTIIKNV